MFLLILFLIAAPLAVFYSLGWRFDWETKKVIQPGIFYFKAWPKSAEVYLNGKLKKKTDFFFGSVLIENLFPKKYEVEIKKDGFQAWKKVLEIKERGVTEAKNIVLIPENPGFKLLSKGVENFFLSPDGKKIILKENSWPASRSPAEQGEGWVLKLFELDKNLKSHLINEKDISRMEVELIELKFSPDSKNLLLEVGMKERLAFYLLELDKAPPALIPLDFLGLESEELYFNPKNPEKLLLLKAGRLSEADLVAKKTSLPLAENIIVSSVDKDNIYYLDSSGFLFKNDFSFSQRDKLNIIPFPLKKEAGYEIAISDSKAGLKENDILYLLDENKKSFEKISEPVKNFRFSPDSKKLVYFNNYEIWVLFLEKINEIPRKEAGDKIFITRFSEKIDDVFWYTDHYLIFNLENKIKIAEIDERERINIVDLAEFKNPEIFWVNKKLYILSEENLYLSEQLIP